ncbi:alpha/beta fold hydrolase [Nocardia yunnanensis]|uniref:alpha/beta fold hydrolase n=1 Tax=Nocardia yunnanensis TaxID=2382165 RepID=UPI001FE43A41|nr:alpha/beta hydrolase [Nocardia yunnanensis]
MLRISEIDKLAPLARYFRVYAVSPTPGMSAGTTMAEVAADHAAAIRAEFVTAVDVLGVSSGGSIALQLAADHPDIVRTLIIVSSGYTLPEDVRTAQSNYARALMTGRRGLHHLAPALSGSHAIAGLARIVMWLADPLLRPACPADTMAFLRAEDEFDMGARLSEITAPTMVIGGDRDAGYPVETFRRTAAGIPDARLAIYAGASRMGVIGRARFADDVASFARSVRQPPGSSD